MVDLENTYYYYILYPEYKKILDMSDEELHDYIKSLSKDKISPIAWSFHDLQEAKEDELEPYKKLERQAAELKVSINYPDEIKMKLDEASQLVERCRHIQDILWRTEFEEQRICQS